MHIIFLTSESTDKFWSFEKTTHVLLIHLKSHLISCPAKLLDWLGINVAKASSETRHGGLVEGSSQHWYGKSTINVLVLAIAPRTGGFWLQRHTWNNQQQPANTLPWTGSCGTHWPHLTWVCMTSLVKGSPPKFGWNASWGVTQGKSYSEHGHEPAIITPILRKIRSIQWLKHVEILGSYSAFFWKPQIFPFGICGRKDVLATVVSEEECFKMSVCLFNELLQ